MSARKPSQGPGPPDHLFQELVAAQVEWPRPEIIRGEVPELAEPARGRRERALRAALDGGVSVRSASMATGLSAAEIAERCERGDA